MDLPALAPADAVLMRDTHASNSFVCQPQQRNMAGAPPLPGCAPLATCPHLICPHLHHITDELTSLRTKHRSM